MAAAMDVGTMWPWESERSLIRVVLPSAVVLVIYRLYQRSTKASADKDADVELADTATSGSTSADSHSLSSDQSVGFLAADHVPLGRNATFEACTFNIYVDDLRAAAAARSHLQAQLPPGANKDEIIGAPQLAHVRGTSTMR